jgi:hypothetical protein
MSRPLSFRPGLRRGIDRIKRFFRWWGSELDELLVEVADRFGSRWRRTLRLNLCAEGVHVICYRRSRVERQELWSRDSLDDGSDPRWKTLPARACLGIPSEWYLRTVMEFPIAARQDLESAVELRLARTSPVPLSEVYWTHQVSAADTTLKVTVVMVRKAAVDRCVGILRERGITVHVLEPAPPEPYPFNIPLSRGGVVNEPTLRRANWALAALATIALVCVAFAWQQRTGRTEEALESLYAAVRADAARDLDLRERFEVTQRTLRDLGARAGPSPSSTLLAALQEVLPPPIWIQSLDAQGREAHVVLYVPPRAEVAKLLLENPAIQSVTENSRVSLGVGITEERVELLVVLSEPAAT